MEVGGVGDFEVGGVSGDHEGRSSVGGKEGGFVGEFLGGVLVGAEEEVSAGTLGSLGSEELGAVEESCFVVGDLSPGVDCGDGGVGGTVSFDALDDVEDGLWGDERAGGVVDQDDGEVVGDGFDAKAAALLAGLSTWDDEEGFGSEGFDFVEFGVGGDDADRIDGRAGEEGAK